MKLFKVKPFFLGKTMEIRQYVPLFPSLEVIKGWAFPFGWEKVCLHVAVSAKAGGELKRYLYFAFQKNTRIPTTNPVFFEIAIRSMFALKNQQDVYNILQ